MVIVEEAVASRGAVQVKVTLWAGVWAMALMLRPKRVIPNSFFIIFTRFESIVFNPLIALLSGENKVD